MNRKPRYKTFCFSAVLAVVAIGFTTGCEAVDKAMDCARTANAVAGSVNDLQKAVEGAANDPAQVEKSLSEIDKNLKSVGDSTGDADVAKATGDLRKSVSEAREAVRNGDPTPDIAPVKAAAGELTKVCTP